MKPAFIILSAIHTKFGVFNSEERIEQTVKTLRSIKTFCPDAIMLLADCSGLKALTEEEKDIFRNLGCTVVDFHKEHGVKQNHDNIDSADIVKNYTEMLILPKVIKMIIDNNLFNDCDRIFKLSGRYELTAEFKNIAYKNIPDQYVVRGPIKSQFPPKLSGYVMNQCMSRLWSWPYKKSNDVINMLNLMLEHFIDRVQNGKGYIDTEHLLYVHLPPLETVYASSIGVTGQIGPNGTLVID